MKIEYLLLIHNLWEIRLQNKRIINYTKKTFLESF